MRCVRTYPVRGKPNLIWFGPAGARTPLHHDVNNIMTCQIYGRERIQFVAPRSDSLLRTVHGYYAPREWKTRMADEEHPLSVQTVDSSAGEALFLPVGYWHEVEALEPSMHVSMLGFLRPNSSAWYKPGFVGA